MAEELPITDSFSLDLQWPANPGKGGDVLLDNSIARFQMTVGKKRLQRIKLTVVRKIYI